MDDKLLKDLKFLSDVKRAALDHKDVQVPYANADLYQTQMFVLGVVRTLIAHGYTIEKKKNAT